MNFYNTDNPSTIFYNEINNDLTNNTSTLEHDLFNNFSISNSTVYSNATNQVKNVFKEPLLNNIFINGKPICASTNQLHEISTLNDNAWKINDEIPESVSYILQHSKVSNTSMILRAEENIDDNIFKSESKIEIPHNSVTPIQMVHKLQNHQVQDYDQILNHKFKSEEIKHLPNDSIQILPGQQIDTRSLQSHQEPSLSCSFPSKLCNYQLMILAQPEDQHRARYLTEGSRGAIKDKSGQGHPIVKLVGCTEPLILQVFVACEVGKLKPHGFYQACKVAHRNSANCTERDIEGTTVIETPFDPSQDMTIIVDFIGILKLRNTDVEQRIGLAKLKKKKNTSARLVFRVNIPKPDGSYITLQIASDPILCTQPTGAPEICKKSISFGDPRGGDEMFIIGKNFMKGTSVIFEEIENEQVVWSKEADIDQDFFQMSHLVCKVPAYQNIDLKKPVNAQIIIHSGGRTSDPVPFIYNQDATLKRPYMSNKTDDIISEEDKIVATKQPIDVLSENDKQIELSNCFIDNTTPNAECNPILVIPNEILGSTQELDATSLFLPQKIINYEGINSYLGQCKEDQVLRPDASMDTVKSVETDEPEMKRIAKSNMNSSCIKEEINFFMQIISDNKTPNNVWPNQHIDNGSITSLNPQIVTFKEEFGKNENMELKKEEPCEMRNFLLDGQKSNSSSIMDISLDDTVLPLESQNNLLNLGDNSLNSAFSIYNNTAIASNYIFQENQENNSFQLSSNVLIKTSNEHYAPFYPDESSPLQSANASSNLQHKQIMETTDGNISNNLKLSLSELENLQNMVKLANPLLQSQNYEDADKINWSNQNETYLTASNSTMSHSTSNQSNNWNQNIENNYEQDPIEWTNKTDEINYNDIWSKQAINNNQQDTVSLSSQNSEFDFLNVDDQAVDDYFYEILQQQQHTQQTNANPLNKSQAYVDNVTSFFIAPTIETNIQQISDNVSQAQVFLILNSENQQLADKYENELTSIQQEFQKQCDKNSQHVLFLNPHNSIQMGSNHPQSFLFVDHRRAIQNMENTIVYVEPNAFHNLVDLTKKSLYHSIKISDSVVNGHSNHNFLCKQMPNDSMHPPQMPNTIDQLQTSNNLLGDSNNSFSSSQLSCDSTTSLPNLNADDVNRLLNMPSPKS